MTRLVLSAFRKTLEIRQNELQRAICTRGPLAIAAGPDALDHIQASGERDYAVADLERDAFRLRQVQTALRRVAAGTFGVCVVCEADIDAKRLVAVSWASSCRVCQYAADRGLRAFPRGMGESLVTAA